MQSFCQKENQTEIKNLSGFLFESTRWSDSSAKNLGFCEQKEPLHFLLVIGLL